MKKRLVICILTTVLIISIGFNISLFKRNLEFKENNGYNIRFILEYTICFLPKDYILPIISNSNHIDEKHLLKLLGYYHSARAHVARIPMKHEMKKIVNFIVRTDDNLSDLYRMIEEDKGTKEINSLVEQIKINQQKSIDVFNKIQQLYSEKYVNEDDDDFFMGVDKDGLAWFEMFDEACGELIQILKELNE